MNGPALISIFETICHSEPDRPSIFLPGLSRTLAASALWDLHRAYVSRLSRAGLAAGDLIVSGTGNRPDLIALLLACRSLDVVLMAADAGTTHAELTELSARFGARLLVVPANSAPAGSATGNPEFQFMECDGQPQSYAGAAILKLTSGSTGKPRATFTTEAQLIADGRQIVETMRIRPEDTQLAAIPLSHSYGLGVLVMPLLLQGTALVLRDAFVPHQLASDAREFGARRFPGVPFMFEYLLEHSPEREWPAGLDRLISAGAPLSPVTAKAFHDRFGVKVHAFYGTTETGGICYDESDDKDVVTTVGRPLAGVTLALRPDEDLPGGRVHVSSAAVSSGYIGSDPGDFMEGGFLTGDYGTIADDGRLTLSGRVSSFINVAGRKVQPEEVEATLRTMPNVADVRVIGGTDERRGQHVVACIVPGHQGDPLTTLAVRRFCADRLAPHKIPRDIVFLETIPLTARGKTDRHALEDLIRRRRQRTL